MADKKIGDDFVYRVLEKDLNSKGAMHGGTVAYLADNYFGSELERITGFQCWTGWFEIIFRRRVMKNETLRFRGRINRVWRRKSKLEVEFAVFSSGEENRRLRKLAYAGFIHFFLSRSDGKPADISGLESEIGTKAEKEDFRAAGLRHMRVRKLVKAFNRMEERNGRR